MGCAGFFWLVGWSLTRKQTAAFAYAETRTVSALDVIHAYSALTRRHIEFVAVLSVVMVSGLSKREAHPGTGPVHVAGAT